MRRRRKRGRNPAKQQKRDVEYWANKTSKLIASLPSQERDVINFFWPLIETTIDRKTKYLTLQIVHLDTEKKKYTNELMYKFAKKIRRLAKRLIEMNQKEIDSASKPRDSPREA